MSERDPVRFHGNGHGYSHRSRFVRQRAVTSSRLPRDTTAEPATSGALTSTNARPPPAGRLGDRVLAVGRLQVVVRVAVDNFAIDTGDRDRAFHFDRHCRDTPASAATWAIGRCSQRRTRRPLPAGVNGALAWDTTGLLGSDELLALHILPTGTRPRLIAPASPTS